MESKCSKLKTIQGLLALIDNDPIGFRKALQDNKVLKALSDIGVPPYFQILELHAPHPKARKNKGVGMTLCGRKGTRHMTVTCKDCLNRKAKNLGPPD